MAIYCIGDLHGCYDEFMQLLELIDFDPKQDELLLTGDLIGRGPQPLLTLNFVLRYQKCIQAVLGNHDLNFLAVCNQGSQARERDHLQEVLDAENLEEILEYYYQLPLIYFCDKEHLVLSHAGIYPQWTLSTAKKIGKELHKVLTDPLRRGILLRNMYKDTPNHYNEDDQGLSRWRFALNAFTRMRLLDKNLVLDYEHSAATLQTAREEKLTPWYDFWDTPLYDKKPYTLIFGHWAALNGQCQHKHVIALDTGCVWGGSLTCYGVDTGKTYRVKSLGHLTPQGA
ncbi:MAG: symmetrical bis(5'-nucleosyl)-tetraphosphatase [Succinivibrio sp.]|nr:symmetrical bis(5'-nucleosyl)-tetraphosphatase [Succinivibrio sp.]